MNQSMINSLSFPFVYLRSHIQVLMLYRGFFLRLVSMQNNNEDSVQYLKGKASRGSKIINSVSSSGDARRRGFRGGLARG